MRKERKNGIKEASNKNKKEKKNYLRLAKRSTLS